MTPKKKFTAFQTIFIHELRRVLRLWMQTLLPPAITMALYFVIFGHVIGRRIGGIAGYSYIQFISPGLIMMSIITSSYASSVSSLYSAKFHRSIEELLVSPMSSITILMGYMTGGVFRGVLVGTIVSIIALFFIHLHIHSVIAILMVALLSSSIFSLAGIINAIYAKKFDDIYIIPTFVLTPLTYLGCVFYSIKLLPTFWYYLSFANPIVYMVDNFRYGFLGISDSHVIAAYSMMILFVALLFFVALHLIKKGVGLRQ